MKVPLIVLAAILGLLLGYAVYAFVMWDINPGNYGADHRSSLVLVSIVFSGLCAVGVGVGMKDQ